MESKTTYFGYGSNIWLEQMHKRCPENKFIGVGRLTGWKWIINTRGYASIIPSPGDIVYGFIFELTPKDERSLDGFEGWSYKKLYIPITKGPQEMVTALVYVDVERTEIGESKKEYVHRLNNAIVDGLKEGIPKGYVDRYIRPFIPAEPADCIGT